MSAKCVHITRWGNSGPLTVMIHGAAQGSSVGGDRHFAAQAAVAQHGWQIVVPDRPGHGRSADPGRPDDAEADGEWIAELLGDGAHHLIVDERADGLWISRQPPIAPNFGRATLASPI